MCVCVIIREREILALALSRVHTCVCERERESVCVPSGMCCAESFLRVCVYSRSVARVCVCVYLSLTRSVLLSLSVTHPRVSVCMVCGREESQTRSRTEERERRRVSGCVFPN